MAFNLLDLKPHEVSRDLSGYITLLYGPPEILGIHKVICV